MAANIGCRTICEGRAHRRGPAGSRASAVPRQPLHLRPRLGSDSKHVCKRAGVPALGGGRGNGVQAQGKIQGPDRGQATGRAGVRSPPPLRRGEAWGGRASNSAPRTPAGVAARVRLRCDPWYPRRPSCRRRGRRRPARWPRHRSLGWSWKWWCLEFRPCVAAIRRAHHWVGYAMLRGDRRERASRVGAGGWDWSPKIRGSESAPESSHSPPMVPQAQATRPQDGA